MVAHATAVSRPRRCTRRGRSGQCAGCAAPTRPAKAGIPCRDRAKASRPPASRSSPPVRRTRCCTSQRDGDAPPHDAAVEAMDTHRLRPCRSRRMRGSRGTRRAAAPNRRAGAAAARARRARRRRSRNGSRRHPGVLTARRPGHIVSEERRLDRSDESWARRGGDIEDGDVGRLRTERDPEATAVRAQREVSCRPGNTDPSDDPMSDEIDHRHGAPLRLAHVGNALRRVHRCVAGSPSPVTSPTTESVAASRMETGRTPCARRALAEAVALDAARARRHRNPLHDPAGARVDGDETRLEVGRHERNDASARNGGQEPLGHRPGDERRRSGEEEVAAPHARDYGGGAPRGPGTSTRPIRIWGHGPRGTDPSYSREGMATRWRDERALVRGAQGGSAAALDKLFRLHWRRAHRAAYLVVHDAAAAEDIAQEAFLAAIRNLDRSTAAARCSLAASHRRQPGDRPRPRPDGPTDLQPSLAAPATAPDARRRRSSRRSAAFHRIARSGRSPLPARVHAGRDRDDAEHPAGTSIPAAARARRDAGGGS